MKFSLALILKLAVCSVEHFSSMAHVTHLLGIETEQIDDEGGRRLEGRPTGATADPSALAERQTAAAAAVADAADAVALLFFV